MMKTMIATRAFKDAGTGRSFAAGETIADVEDGVLENYEAAGLVEQAPEAAPEATKRKAAPRRRKASVA